MNNNAKYTWSFIFPLGCIDSYGDRVMPGAFKDFEKTQNTNNALAKQSKFNNAFNVQTVEIIEEIKKPVV